LYNFVDRYFIVSTKIQILNISSLEKYDLMKMYQIYDKWPEIAQEAFESKQTPIDFQNIDHIVFAGMGGSGAIGDVFEAILSKSKIHVNVVKGYVLPKTVNSKTLVIAISVSGDTMETLSILKSAQKLNCRIITFSSNGKMLEFCMKNNIEHRNVKQYHSPRASFTSYLYTILKVLYQTLKISENEILESIIELKNNSKKINSSNLTESNPSLMLAEWITGIPIVYYPFGLKSSCIRFKNSLNENAKMHVLTEDIIEMCHNGIVGWETKSMVQPILIQGKDDHLSTKKRWQILKEYFLKNNIEYKEIISIEGCILSKIINLVYFFDYSSIYKAVINEIDPTTIESIKYIKSKLD
jgi:glucose/mannose-6-phosphate isomerase